MDPASRTWRGISDDIAPSELIATAATALTTTLQYAKFFTRASLNLGNRCARYNAWMYPAEWEQHFRSEIPSLEKAGIRVIAAEPTQVILRAPLEVHRNPHGTGFGGSQVSLCTLAGYVLAHEVARSLGLSVDVVVQRSRMEYKRPVRGDLLIAATPSAFDAKAVADSFRRRKLGIIRVQARLQSVEEPNDAPIVASYFRAIYVAKLAGSASEQPTGE